MTLIQGDQNLCICLALVEEWRYFITATTDGIVRDVSLKEPFFVVEILQRSSEEVIVSFFNFRPSSS